MTFKGKRTLITGGAGFIGSNLAHRLHAEGAQVVIVDSMDPACGGNFFNLAGLQGAVRFVRGTIADAALMRRLLPKVEIVFNLAGNVSHQASMTDPFADLEANARAHLCLLETCRRVQPDAVVVYASTRQVFGVPDYLPVDERHPIRPVDINGIHKFAGEQYHLVYARAYGLRATALRLTNTYGPRQLIRHARQGFIGWFIHQALRRETIALYGGGAQVRDFLHVDDVVDALLRAAERDACRGAVYNLAGECASLETVARLLQRLTGVAFTSVPFPEAARRIDIGDYSGSSSLFEAATGWRPRVPLAQGLKSTLAFFRQHGGHYLGAAA